MNITVRLQDCDEPIGLNAWADRPALQLLVRARKALAQWSTDKSAGFPYEPLLDYYRSVGRNGADVTLARRLREAVPTGERCADPWLPAWVEMVTDAETGTYDGYLGSALLQEVDLRGRIGLAPENGDAGPTSACDTVILTLLADLAHTEMRQLRQCPTRCTFCVRRLRAVVNAVRRAEEFAPLAVNLAAPAGAGADPDDPTMCTAVTEGTPQVLRTLADISLVPTTVVHDEIMFIRSVQMLELLYRQVARALAAARRAVAADDVDTAVDLIRGCTRRVRGTAALYRVVTTISPQAFGVIREATDGRSAVQSRAFRDVERLCGESIPAALETASPASRSLVLTTCAGLDEAWRAMKRSHWGIARKVIGDVPGTGGTTGASYLRTRADQSLFPRAAAGEGEAA